MGGLAIEEAGEGVPVVLLHGLTATRRYVVMGSKTLERSGHRVIAYDARGHGQSEPATPYSYEALAGDLLGVLDGAGVERAVLAGASMGAHTLLRFALDHPERALALVAHHACLRSRGVGRRPRALGRPVRRPAHGRRGGIRGRVRRAGGARGDARHRAHRHPPAPVGPRAPRRGGGRAARGAALARVLVLGRPRRARPAGHRGGEPRRGRSRPPVRDRRALRGTSSRARGSCRRSPASPRSPGRAASSRA